MTVDFTSESFERLFDAFVRSVRGGERLDVLLAGKIPRDAKCADYFFGDDGIIAELKTLNQNHGEKSYVLGEIRKGLVKYGYPDSRLEAWIGSVAPLPSEVVRYVDARVQNSLKNMVRKANEQVSSSRRILRKRHDSVLLVANLSEYLFGPVELVRYVAGHALSRTALSIDAILVISPGVTYSSGASAPQHYIMPVYAEGKEYIGDFLEPLVAKYIHFEANYLGKRPFIEVAFELDEASKAARPVGKQQP